MRTESVRPPRERGGRERGALLVEAMFALTVLTVGLLSYLASFQANFRTVSDVQARDLAHDALQNTVDTLRSVSLSSLYLTYQDKLIPVPGLPTAGGAPASVQVHFDVNETALPAEYGPVGDIDGDGLKSTVNASASYVLLPARLAVSYAVSHGTETATLYLILR